MHNYLINHTFTLTVGIVSDCLKICLFLVLVSLCVDNKISWSKFEPKFLKSYYKILSKYRNPTFQHITF